ncbi:restriction endonuclease subunit S [Vibrio parahaemolyticus]|uniref:restriction endonuclease subunit S n=1 Tax=Vibrio parahaemolyticus TaxID=670 RepID=UPI0016505915|nr:hypothetical protein [Vibrio parahaemolyticus]EHR6472057.1 hypothetical protein [Vibrio parahaemolyticus]MBE3683293.1 hypothetical protein [Vibrio parahaemolyticus]
MTNNNYSSTAAFLWSVADEEQISLLQERKSDLISAAVTGKIDVRDWIMSDEVRS